MCLVLCQQKFLYLHQTLPSLKLFLFDDILPDWSDEKPCSGLSMIAQLEPILALDLWDFLSSCVLRLHWLRMSEMIHWWKHLHTDWCWPNPIEWATAVCIRFVFNVPLLRSWHWPGEDLSQKIANLHWAPASCFIFKPHSKLGKVNQFDPQSQRRPQTSNSTFIQISFIFLESICFKEQGHL